MVLHVRVRGKLLLPSGELATLSGKCRQTSQGRSILKEEQMGGQGEGAWGLQKREAHCCSAQSTEDENQGVTASDVVAKSWGGIRYHQALKRLTRHWV
jgi:hypothetical protein